MTDTALILALAQDYFDALYEGDTQKFARIFHADARLYCIGGGNYITMDVQTYLGIVAGREAPAARGDVRHDEVLSVSIASATTAHLRVRELFAPRRFTDELLLIKDGAAWKIVAKLWDFEVLND